jgi:8-oxo-dGTP pyrophosphatase MutT (NUDIX family)
VNILKSIKTVGAFVLYKDKLVFMIGPDNTGNKLGIVRFGGHIEENEDIFLALEREIMEEAAINITLVSSPVTYYKSKWEQDFFDISEDTQLKIKPIIVKGDEDRTTALFLSYADQEPKPSAETYGAIFLNEREILDICTKKISLHEFLASDGKIIQQINLDYDMEIYAGVHLKAFYDLLVSGNNIVKMYLKRAL